MANEYGFSSTYNLANMGFTPTPVLDTANSAIEAFRTTGSPASPLSNDSQAEVDQADYLSEMDSQRELLFANNAIDRAMAIPLQRSSPQAVVSQPTTSSSASPLNNEAQAKVDQATYQRTMDTMQQISMENSMRQMRYQTQQAMMSGEVAMNGHLANAHITNIDTLGKIMNKGYNKANSAIQSQ